MFDTYKFKKAPSKIEVVEKKAPTDDSIRLLNEMQEKAFDNIIDHVQLSNNELKDIRCWIYPDQYSYIEKCFVRFKLNGKDVDFTINLPCRYTETSQIIQEIRDRVIFELANVICSELVRTNISTLKDIYKR